MFIEKQKKKKKKKNYLNNLDPFAWILRKSILSRILNYNDKIFFLKKRIIL
jgi:hypothetical protein